MSWGKIDGGLAFHPKIVAAGNEAVGAWVRMLSYSCEHLTDGKIAIAIALPMAKQETIDRLVACRLLDVVDGGYAIHNFAIYNPSGPEVAARRAEISAKRAEAGRRGAAAKWQRAGKLPSGAMATARQVAIETDGKNMAPSPSPSPSPEESPSPPATPLQDCKGVASGPLQRAAVIENSEDPERAEQLAPRRWRTSSAPRQTTQSSGSRTGRTGA